MREKIQLILGEYLKVFPNERTKLSPLWEYLLSSTNEEIVDWNNRKGHLTAGAFIYCRKSEKFLVLFHKDLQMYLYPGGHMDPQDRNPFATALRELKEETGLEQLELLKSIGKIPFDIDIHLIPENERIHMPAHYHYDFRYLFLLNDIEGVILDQDEFSDYKWVSFEELYNDKNYGNVVKKLQKFLKK